MINVFEYCPRGYIEGGYYQSFPVITVGIIRTRVLFKGGPYMRNYEIFPLKTMRENLTELFMEIKGGNILMGKNFEGTLFK